MGQERGWTVEVRDPGETERLARTLGQAAEVPSVLVLTGPLGAGKTTFSRGLAAGLGADPSQVHSPTFALVHEYPGKVPLYHFDAYRLATAAEFADLGPEEYFDRPGVSVVEWGERVQEYLPPDHLEVTLALDDHKPNARRIRFAARGPKSERWLDAVRRAWEEQGGSCGS
ncbi:MAG: tRNA (adenosine(37)-N6)-threonylcarbamoyltransferase complex ATPase subunit type 1 TsaE [Firmicutes bacterium]|nr:tRNA (adenosine(37)-N6)-threonylcarbamoyltransferase complex ATPase subunit type 1 TsaE [Bacillota bacterium]